MTTDTKAHGRAKRITLERTYKAALDDVWELWTTKAGIESWWGPDGFTVAVEKLELRPGGALHYAMTATAPEQVAFMKNQGMPLTSRVQLRFTEVVPKRRLAYTMLANFVPGLEPYDVTTAVDFHASGDAVRIVVVLDAMHDEEWTRRMISGKESELDRLAHRLAL